MFLKLASNDAYPKVVIFVVLTSVAIWGSHRMGAMKIHLDLLEHQVVQEIGPIYAGNTSGSFLLDDNKPSATNTCLLEDISGYNLCGLSFVLNTDFVNGINLSAYDSISLSIKYNAPFDAPKLRVSFRNFSDRYSGDGDFVSLKYNTIVYSPAHHEAVIEVPLNAFHVEAWWVEQNGIEFRDAQLDFSNINFFEVVSNAMPQTGKYRVEINKAVLKGESISEGNLLKLLMVFWLLMIIFLVSLQRNRLKVISTKDSLTGLWNRRGLDDWVAKFNTFFSKKATFVLFYFDIDDFKLVNDTFGHLVGDELLCAFCDKTLDQAHTYLRDKHKFAFARLAGDEFAIVIEGMALENTPPLASKIMSALSEPLILSNHTVKLNVSLGIASYHACSKAFEELMMRADSAMYLAKKHGKNQYRIFDDKAAEEVFFCKQVAEKLRRAIDKNQFRLVFMPIYEVNGLSIVGCEALVRCTSPDLDGIGPGQFIPIAEQYDLIQKLDLWVVENTLQRIRDNSQLIKDASLKFSINISARELRNRHFTKAFGQLLKHYKVNPAVLELEVTETSLVDVDEVSISVLEDLRTLGVSLALDDFGTGYTAFSQLIRYPVDCLKIDKSFIDNLDKDEEAPQTTVNAILSIAKSYKLTTVAEGIETQSQFEYMREHGCDSVQGFYFSKPIEWAELEVLLPKKTVE